MDGTGRHRFRNSCKLAVHLPQHSKQLTDSLPSCSSPSHPKDMASSPKSLQTHLLSTDT